jgi:uncharacterized membrane protein
MTGIEFIYPQYLWLLLLIPLTVGLALLGRRGMGRARAVAGLALRVLLLLLMILALSGIQLRLPSRMLTAIFVLDASDSIPPAEQDRGEALVREAIRAMPSGDRSAVVVFGEDALVERLASPDSELSRLASQPVTTRTDIASALQLAMALFPDEGARRLVLLSDGRENIDSALKQAELAGYQDIELTYIPLGEAQNDVEVLLDSLEAPSNIREGQRFDLTVQVQSSAPVGATLRVYGDDNTLIQSREVNLREGMNRYTIPMQDVPSGFHRFRAQILPDADNRLQNNEASAFTIVHGPPSILLVEGSPGEGENLAPALAAAQMDVSVVPPSGIPATLPELARYDAVILANVPAAALPAGAMEALPIYIRDLGKGVLMTGGDASFGAGGYLRTPIEAAMPVYMDVRSRELSANLALIMAVDKSGSMGRCHCDNPDLNQTYTPVETGQPKVDIAKEAIMRSAQALGDQDYLGVVTFDTQAHWTLEVQPLVGPGVLENAIGTFRAEGQTNMVSGVTAAYDALKTVNAKRKHIILMTDGWVHTGDLTPLVTQMREEGITLSIIAAGEGSAEYLKNLSFNGGGTFYPAVDMMSVPDIFLKETIKSVGQYIVEGPFPPLANPDRPTPLLRGLDQNALPILLGYNGTSPKNTARLDLLTPRGDPLLASWQYGLGRAAVWTSDMKGRWGSQWVQWQAFPQFAAQTVGWLLPAPQEEGLNARVVLEDRGAVITFEAQDAQGSPRNNLDVQARLIDPDLKVSEVTLQQVGPGQYQAPARADQPGTYLVWLSASENGRPTGQVNLGMVVPYSPEYRSGGINRGLLDTLARITGGGPLAQPVEAFLHNLPSASAAREIGRTLLLLAALLFPIDVALRRLILTRRDVQTARAWVVERLPWRRAAAAAGEPVLGPLHRARERARQRNQRTPDNRTNEGEPGTGAGQRRPESEAPPTAPGQQPPPTAPPRAAGDPDDSFARLREAKKRARK